MVVGAGGRVKGETRKSMQLSHPMLIERGYVVKELLGIGAEGDVVRCERMVRSDAHPRAQSASVSMRLSELVSGSITRRSSQAPSPRAGNRRGAGTGMSGATPKRDSNASSGIHHSGRFQSGRFRLGSVGNTSDQNLDAAAAASSSSNTNTNNNNNNNNNNNSSTTSTAAQPDDLPTATFETVPLASGASASTSVGGGGGGGGGGGFSNGARETHGFKARMSSLPAFPKAATGVSTPGGNSMGGEDVGNTSLMVPLASAVDEAEKDLNQVSLQDAPTSVAVKIISRAYTEREKCEPAVIRELDILRTVRHPHIVTFVETFQTPKHWYLVTEILRGGDLFDAAIRRTFTELQTIDIAIQVLSALEYLHTKGIAHRDIKLENIVYTRKNSSELKLIDFGLAWRRTDHARRMLEQKESTKKLRKKKKKDASSSTARDEAGGFASGPGEVGGSEVVSSSGSTAALPPAQPSSGVDGAAAGKKKGRLNVATMTNAEVEEAVAKDPNLLLIVDEFPGSSAYESPEIVLRKPHHAEQLDIWSTGVVLYALINKKFPFTGDTRKQVQKAIVFKDPPFTGVVWKEVSDDFRKFLMLMMSKDPAARPSAAECSSFMRDLQDRLTRKQATSGRLRGHGGSSGPRDSRMGRASTKFKTSFAAAFEGLFSRGRKNR